MRHLGFIYVIFLLFLIASCSKEEAVTVDKFNTKIELLSPRQGIKYVKGDTIFILATITSDVSMHGYEMLLHKPNEAPFSIKNKHTHGKIINVNDYWVVDFAEQKTVELELVALIDHTGNNLSEIRKVSCN